MCLCFLYFSKNKNSKIKTLLLFNREEFLKRSSKCLGFHMNNSIYQDLLLYPLDVPTQGTFYCINIKTGNICFLLNNPRTSNKYNPDLILKRGDIPIDFCKLDSEENSWNHFIENLNSKKTEFNGFNIIFTEILTK